MHWLRCALTELGYHPSGVQNPRAAALQGPYCCDSSVKCSVLECFTQQPCQDLLVVQAGRPEAVTPSLVQDIGQQWNVNPSSALVPELRHTYEAMIEDTMPPASQPLAYATLHALTCA